MSSALGPGPVRTVIQGQMLQLPDLIHRYKKVHISSRYLWKNAIQLCILEMRLNQVLGISG